MVLVGMMAIEMERVMVMAVAAQEVVARRTLSPLQVTLEPKGPAVLFPS
jgi:hypothetical protein